MGVSSEGALAISYEGITVFYVHKDGDLWSKKAGGFLKRADGPIVKADEALGAPTKDAVKIGDWQIALTEKMHVAFVLHDAVLGWTVKVPYHIFPHAELVAPHIQV